MGGVGGGREGFQEVQVTYNINIHSSYDIKDLVENHLGNIVCDTPIARINKIHSLYHMCLEKRIIELNSSGTNDTTELYVPPDTHTKTTHRSTLERNMDQHKNN